MKILFFIDRPVPNDHVFLEQVYSKILPNKGHFVTIVAKSLSHIDNIQKSKWNSAEVFLIPLKKSKLNIFSDSFFECFYLMKLYKILSKEKYDLVQVRNDPIMAHFGYKFSKFLKVPFVFQLSHLKGEELVYFSKHSLYGSKFLNFVIGKIEQFLRNRMMKKSNLIFPISSEMEKYLRSLPGFFQKKIYPITLCADTSLNFRDYNGKKVREMLNVLDAPLLIYVGTFNRIRNLEMLFDMLKLVLLKFPKVKLLFVGEGKQKDDLDFLKKCAKDSNVSESVIFVDSVSRIELQSYIRASNIGLSPFQPNEILTKNSPIKLMEYMNMAIPVVCNDTPEQKNVILNSGGGFCVNYDPIEFSESVITLLNDPDRAKAMGLLGRTYVENYRSCEIMALEIEKAYGWLN